MNSILLIGNITRKPEMKQTNSGKSVCNFGIAVKRAFAKDETDFINCVSWGKTAELIEQYCDKGSRVGVTGRLQTGSYDKEGVKHYTADVVVEAIDFLTSKKESENSQQDDMHGFTEDDSLDSDIPF